MTDRTTAARPRIPAPAFPGDASHRNAGPRDTAPSPGPAPGHALGPLRDLPGSWSGTGFSLLARPDSAAGSPHGFFLELDRRRETIEFTVVESPLGDGAGIAGCGLTYLHRVAGDATGTASCLEPGLWLTAPAAGPWKTLARVARLATVPRAGAVAAAGFAEDVLPDGQPTPVVNTMPFPIGKPPPPSYTRNPFPEYDLSAESRARTALVPEQITQDVIDDPGLLLRQARGGQTLTQVTRLIASTDGAAAVLPLIAGHASTLTLDCLFAIETVRDPPGRDYLQLQYAQTALLDFDGLSYPHVTVGTLRKTQ